MEADLQNMLMNDTVKAREGANFQSVEGVNITGMVTDIQELGVSQFNPKLKTLAYFVVVGEITNSPSSLVRVLPEPHPGVRFLNSNRTKTKINSAHYGGILERFAAANKEPAPNVEEIIEKGRESIKGSSYWSFELTHRALDAWTKLSVHPGDLIKVKAEISVNTKTLPGEAITKGTYVRVDGMRPNIYLSKPKVVPAPKPVAAAAAADKVEKSEPAPAAVENAAEVAAAAAVAEETKAQEVITNHEDDSLAPHLVDPVTKSSFVFELKASSVVRISIPANDQSIDKRIGGFVKTDEQHFVPGSDSQGLFFCPVNDEGTAFVPGLKRGLLVGPSKPEGRDKLSGETTDANNAGTYENDRGPVMPINIVVTTYQSATTDELTPELRSQYQDVTESKSDPKKVLLKSNYPISSMVWPEAVRESGIVDLETWKDVNAYARIPAQVALKPRSPGKMNVVTVGWETKEYIQKKGFRIPLAYAPKILGNGTQSIGLTEFGQAQKSFFNKELVDISNRSNLIRGAVDLLNASESKNDFAPYLDPTAGWQAWVLMVPNQKNFKSKDDMDEDDRNTILELLAQIPTLKTPEEGQKFIEAFAKERKIKPNVLEKFGINRKEVRVLVWFLKPDPAQAPTPYWKTVAKAAPAPVVTVDKMDVEAPKTPSLPPPPKRKADEIAPAPPAPDSGDKMQVDGGETETEKPAVKPEGPARKKARKE